MRDVQQLGGILHAALAFVARYLAQLQAELQILFHRHVRVKGVVLEDHRDVAILRRHVVHQPVADVDVPLADLFQPRNHAQRGGLAATGRAYENKEFLVLDVQVDVVHGADVARVDFRDAFETNLSHLPNLLCNRCHD